MKALSEQLAGHSPLLLWTHAEHTLLHIHVIILCTSGKKESVAMPQPGDKSDTNT